MTAEGISSKVRRIAILVTSLDASAGRQLLMAMPAELARQVRRAMTQLGHVDPDEQRQILAEFRMQAIKASDDSSALPDAIPTAPPRPQSAQTSHVPLMPDDDRTEAMHTPPIGFSSSNAHARAAQGPMGSGSGSGLTNLDTTTLSELLRGERATVVAVVLSQLEPQRGAELLSKLPKALQREAIVSFSRVGQIDPEAMAAIDEHLASRIADYHHRQAGESESTNRMHELFAAAAPELRSDWQSTLCQAEPLIAARMGLAPTATPSASASSVAAKQSAGPVVHQVVNQAVHQVVKQTSQPAANEAGHQAVSAPRRTSRSASMLELLADNVVTTVDVGVAKTLAEVSSSASDIQDDSRARILPFPNKSHADAAERTIRFEQILDLPADEIGQILAAADTEVILYALAGASPAFMKRFMAMLDRADGRALQARLKQLRAINLKDVDAAQRTLCELAARRPSVRVAA